jgi:tetratricopeptide (TPR) repeat protein
LGNYENALEYHLKARSIREKVLPVMHPGIAQSCHNIAWVYHDMGDYQCALEYMRRAVDIAEKSLPEGHPERVKYRADLENLERDIRQ